MTATHPTEYDREIPLPEVPAAIQAMRESWALEVTRANQLERQLREAERAAADWQHIALQNGEEAARARVDRAFVAGSREELEARFDELRKRYNALETDRDHLREFARYVMEDWISDRVGTDRDSNDYHWIEEWVDDDDLGITEECDACGGTGKGTDEQMVGAPASRDGFEIVDIEAPCDECYRGRVAREA